MAVSMHGTTVLETAARAGIGLERIEIVIDESLHLLGRGLYGYTYPEGDRIVLYPDAFSNEEQRSGLSVMNASTPIRQ